MGFDLDRVRVGFDMARERPEPLLVLVPPDSTDSQVRRREQHEERLDFGDEYLLRYASCRSEDVLWTRVVIVNNRKVGALF